MHKIHTASARAEQLPLPLAIYSYLDVVQFWLHQPLSKDQYNQFKQHCLGKVHRLTKPCRFDPHFRQRIQLHQPKLAALEMIADLDDEPMLNYVEIARDFIFDDEIIADHCCNFFRKYLVQPWHRSSMEVRFFENCDEAEKPNKHRPGPGFQTRTNKVGKRRTGRWLEGYADVCRFTGEVACFHFETRFSSKKSLRRIGIHNPHDLIAFDYDAHFAKYVTLYHLDFERLGRFHKNRRSGAKRKKASVIRYGSFTYNRDHRLGASLYRLFSIHPEREDEPETDSDYDERYPHRSLQQFLDTYEGACRRFLVPIPLPQSYLDSDNCITSSKNVEAQPLLESFDVEIAPISEQLGICKKAECF